MANLIFGVRKRRRHPVKLVPRERLGRRFGLPEADFWAVEQGVRADVPLCTHVGCELRWWNSLIQLFYVVP